ncbi:MAG TPA: hypothetical protein PKE40_10205 [Arachnia sp.]|nr:hypothetical protein [Arachnia sp.]HMT86714.1 hypothetical protein [Arachnia sp.]
MRRAFATALAACLLLAGCSAAPDPGASASPSPGATTLAPAVPTVAPEGGVLLSELGFVHAPAGFSVPASVGLVEVVDQVNNITVVAREPGGSAFAQYLRDNLADMGYEIVADNDDSLLFENDKWVGGFTVTGDLSALSLRTDAERFS